MLRRGCEGNISMKERKIHSLFGNNIKKALAHEQPSLKSEDLPNYHGKTQYRRFFVDNGMLAELKNNANQLIVGRRGTGKTHLFGSFNEVIRDECPDELSLMISLMKLHRDSSIPENCTIAEYRRIHAADLFEDFLRKLFPLFLDQADNKLHQISQSLSNREAKKKLAVVNNLLTQLLEVVELGSPVDVLKTSKKSIDTTESGLSKTGASLSIGVENNKPLFSAKAALGMDTSALEEVKHVIEIHSKMKVDIIKARDLILDILDELKVETLHILIDEWMELDKRTPSGIQPLFAQLLKKTFFNTNKISVKIASVWHQTTLYDEDDMRKSKGVELKHDIIRTVDLDTAFLRSEEQVSEFCKELLYKRISYLFEKLENLSDTEKISQLCGNDGIVDDVFVIELFDNLDNFKAFIIASHGIPRDLMNIFHKCSLRIRRNFELYCIDHQVIYAEARSTYNTDKRKTIKPDSEAQKLLRIINKYMESTDRRLFIVKNSYVPNSDALQKLVDEELIHQLPSSVTPRDICDTHKTYLIDFGNYVDWIETKKKDVATLINESVLPAFPDNFTNVINEYEIDISQVNSDTLECPQCNGKFALNEPVYQKASMCIFCAYDIKA